MFQTKKAASSDAAFFYEKFNNKVSCLQIMRKNRPMIRERCILKRKTEAVTANES
jgi:hypothetical protein